MVRLAGRAVTDYGYNDTGLRITETTTTDGGTPEVKSFLFDTRNPTGLAQVLEEYIDGVLKQVFTIGHDVIAQTDATDPQDHYVYTLLSDGHGSTRTLLSTLGQSVQQYAYDAYGNMLAGTGLTTAAAALTSILYSGQWTMKSGQQYLRARFYDPASGTFNRLDPFAGNLADPQSLHKYLYAHGNPVAFSDPSGNFAEPLLLGGQSGGTTSWVRVITSGLIGAAFAHGDAFLRTMYMTGDLDAATDAARAAAAAGFAMGLAVGMLEGRFTPYIGLAAFSFGLAQSKQALQAGHYELAALDFTLAIFSFFTGVYRPLAAQARGAGRLPLASGNAAPTAPRLSQDINVSPTVPPVRSLSRPIGQSPTQNAALQADIAAARAQGATNFRVNQQQINVAGQRVGVNRPDLQYTNADGARVYVEYDTTSSIRGPGHRTRILANDPNGIVILRTVN